MAAYTLGQKERMLKQMLYDYQIVDRTHQFKVGRPSPTRHQEILLMPPAKKQQFNGRLNKMAAEKCPHGPHPCHVKGSGWCQLNFMEESVELSYGIHGMHLGVDIHVKSKRGDGKVEVWVPQKRKTSRDNTG